MMPRSENEPAVRICVVSPSPLMAETVKAALSSRDLPATIVPWRTAVERATTTDLMVESTPGPLLLVLDPATAPAAAAAQPVVSHARHGCVAVVGGTEKGPLWGAMLEAGADVVIPATASLDEVLDVLSDRGSARSRLDKRTRQLLIGDWHRVQERGGDLAERIWSLTSRELEVLRFLYNGASVRSIAERTGVVESTVRSHRKAVMRKLGVSTQLATVAAYERYLRDQEPAK
jgi:DNA-binding NarL/FixJ family response regulator